MSKPQSRRSTRHESQRSDRSSRSPSGKRTSDRNPRQKPGSKQQPAKGNPRAASTHVSRNRSSGAQTANSHTRARVSSRQAGTTSASSPIAAEPLQAIGRKNGEWYLVKLPDLFKDISVAQALKRLPIPSKIADKLLRDKAVTKQRERLNIRLFPEETPEFVAQWTDLNIVYEDEFTLIVNKPAGLEIYPSAKGQTGTLANHVAAYYQGTGQACRVRHIHRLDKDTTGPVLYAKNELAHYVYDRDMREKKIERIYVAVAEGVLPNDKGKIEQPIGKDRHHSTRRRVSETGEHAVTYYEVIERYAEHTLVRLRLGTGRTHQIRVHLSSIGHPLAGDGLYGGKRGWISRQALHGEQLLFNQAWTGKRMSVLAPWPDDFRKLVDDLRQHSSYR